jgi:hypothetical protein
LSPLCDRRLPLNVIRSVRSNSLSVSPSPACPQAVTTKCHHTAFSGSPLLPPTSSSPTTPPNSNICLNHYNFGVSANPPAPGREASSDPCSARLYSMAAGTSRTPTLTWPTSSTVEQPLTRFFIGLSSLLQARLFNAKGGMIPFWNCTSLLRVHATCQCFLSLLLIHAAFPCYMSMLHVHAACPCSMSTIHLLAACLCPCCMFVLHLHAACPWCMPTLHVCASRPCCMFMQHVPAECFTLHFRAICSCSVSILHIHAVKPCCNPLRHVRGAFQSCMSSCVHAASPSLMSVQHVHTVHVHAVFPCCLSLLYFPCAHVNAASYVLAACL